MKIPPGKIFVLGDIRESNLEITFPLARLSPTFTANAADPTLSLQERMAMLEAENQVLKTKVETLMAVVGKG